MTVKSANKPHRKTKIVLATVVGLVLLRVLKLAYKRSRLEGVVGTLVGGDDRVVKLDKKFIDSLPDTGIDFRGRTTEPLNFIFLGESSQIESAFAATGWQAPVPINAANWLRAFYTGLRDKPYATAPITPYYIYTTPQELAFQKETKRRSTRERHHIRIWNTNFILADNTKLWLGMASFDASLRLVNGWHFPYHHIAPDLDAERDFVTKQLTAVGAKSSHRFELSAQRAGRNNYGDKYQTDGHIIVMDMRGVKDEATD